MKNFKSIQLTENEISVYDPTTIIVPLKESQKEQITVKLKEKVKTGQRLANGVYSPVTGIIAGFEEVAFIDGGKKVVRIIPDETEEFDQILTQKFNFEEMKWSELANKLNRANLNLNNKIDDNRILIFNGVDPQPHSAVSEYFIQNYIEQIIDGIKFLTKTVSPKKCIMVIPSHLDKMAEKIKKQGIEIFKIKKMYPYTLPILIAHQLTKHYPNEEFTFFRVEKLVALDNYIKTGKPYSHKIVTVIEKNNSKNMKIRIGTPMDDFLQHSDPGKVIINGALNGYTANTFELPVTDQTDSIFIQEKNEVIFNKNSQCINCGRCVKACPIDLNVNLICRYSEFSLFDKALELGGSDCFECGVCAYNCPAGRSLVQMIKLAKHQVAVSEEEVEK